MISRVNWSCRTFNLVEGTNFPSQEKFTQEYHLDGKTKAHLIFNPRRVDVLDTFVSLSVPNQRIAIY